MKKQSKTAVIATHQTYDRHDCTSTGYDIQIRDDGTARLESHSNWQNSRSGVVYIATVPASVMESIEPDDDAPDLETAIGEWLQSCDPSEWRKIRAGYVVR